MNIFSFYLFYNYIETIITTLYIYSVITLQYYGLTCFKCFTKKSKSGNIHE